VQEAKRRLEGSTSPAVRDSLARVTALEARLVTPPVRYSRPGLQAHIAYLYSATTGADQKVGRDAAERYAVLRRELDAAQAEARAAIGPEPPGWAPAPQPRPNSPAPGDDDESEDES
jgi:hypothetical protein